MPRYSTTKPRRKGPSPTFTPQENRVMRLLMDAHNGESICNQLGITQNTLRRHITNMTQKAGCNSRMELMQMYYKRMAPKVSETMKRVHRLQAMCQKMQRELLEML